MERKHGVLGMKTIGIALIVALTVIALALVIERAHAKGADRRHAERLACIEKTDSGAEAALCTMRNIQR